MNGFYLIVKCIFIGNSGVGKTSIIERYIRDTYQSKSTIGVEFYCKKLQIDKLYFKLHIWDLAGQMTYRNIVQNYYRNTAVVFYVFNNDLDDCHQWLHSIHNWENKQIVFINNKSDIVSNELDKKQILEIVN